jgi:RNA polymerase sigma factor (sigma-70 family)
VKRDLPGTQDETPDIERFNEVFARHYSTVLAYLYRRTSESFDAEEIAAATFVTAWRRLDRVPAEPETRKWLLFVARRNLSNHARTRNRRARLLHRLAAFDLVPAREEQPSDLSDDPLILEAFAKLRPREREVLRLVHWDGLSHAEAADVLDCTVNAFDVRLFRAREALRNQLSELEQPADTAPRRRRNRGSEVDGHGA